jgi:competence protein ComEC
MLHERRKSIACALLAIFMLINVSTLFVGCNQNLTNNEIKVYNGASVSFLDVGQGDCIFIRLPDGKNVLIDTGDADDYDKKYEYVLQYLSAYSVNVIDYLIITHPDSDHVGNGAKIVENVTVRNAFVPYIIEQLLPYYPYFQSTLNALEQSGANVMISDCYKNVVGKDYALVFLSPMEKSNQDSSYFHFNGMQIPDESASNNLSPIIYLDMLGTRFLFTGVAGKSQEQLVVENYYSNFYERTLLGLDARVVLENIDYFKVAHHGADTSSSANFLSVIAPKNAIISVGGNNFYGHPKTETLYRIYESNADCKVYRTDVHGTVIVYQLGDDFVVSTQ